MGSQFVRVQTDCSKQRLKIAVAETKEKFIRFSCKISEVDRAGLWWWFFTPQGSQGLGLFPALGPALPTMGPLPSCSRDGTLAVISTLQPQDKGPDGMEQITDREGLGFATQHIWLCHFAQLLLTWPHGNGITAKSSVRGGGPEDSVRSLL